MISLLHPSRCRPLKSYETTRKWLASAGIDDVEVIVSIDEDEPMLQGYLDKYQGREKIRLIVNDNKTSVQAINQAAKVASGDIMIVASDDTDCPENWAHLILMATEGKSDFVLKTFDGAQTWIVTMPVLDRVYYNRFGYVYYPEYQHQFCDTEFTHVADVTKKIIWRNDILFRHLHYSVLKEQKDDVYRKNDNTWHEGERLYLKRFKECFGLMDVNRWDISDDRHYHWLKQHIRK